MYGTRAVSYCSPSAHPLARILQEQGWDTAAFIGSAVLKKLFGFNNGFAVYDDEMPRPGKRNEFREDPERKASVTVDRAIDWLNKRLSDKPFFLWVHIYDPHIPYKPPAEFAQKYRGPSIRWRNRLLGPADCSSVRRRREEIAPGEDCDGRACGSRRELGRTWRTHTRCVHIRFDTADSLPHGRARHSSWPARKTTGPHDRFSSDPAPGNGRGRAPGYVQGLSLVPALSGKSVATDISYAETLYPKMNMNWSELRGHPHEPLEVHPRAASRAL